MDRYYSRRNLEDLVVPNYEETSDSYSFPDMWDGWNANSQKAVQKSFDFDVINNGFSGGLYSQMDIGRSGQEEEEEEEEEAKRLKASGDCFYNHLDGIQHMDDDDIFLNSILEDVPDNNRPGSSSAPLQVPMFHFNMESCQAMPHMEEEPSTEEVVLQDLQRATEMLSDDTRICFRDTFYRLAKNSQQKSNTSNTNTKDDRNQKSESETNSIDRAVANLTFNKMESNMRNMPPPKRLSSIQR